MNIKVVVSFNRCTFAKWVPFAYYDIWPDNATKLLYAFRNRTSLNAKSILINNSF
jgi:hypothetical protein